MEKGKKNRSGKGGEVPEVLDVAEGRTPEADKEAGALFLGKGALPVRSSKWRRERISLTLSET